MRPFRVLIIDDDGYDAVERRVKEPFSDFASYLKNGDLPSRVDSMTNLLKHVSRLGTGGQVHAYLAGDVFLNPETVQAMNSHTAPWEDGLLRELDVLVLDLGFNEPEAPEGWSLPDGLSSEEADQILCKHRDRGALHGVGFYLKECAEPTGRLRNCQCVIILTAWDGAEAPEVVTKRLDPLIGDRTIPFTVKQHTRSIVTGEAFKRSFNIIQSLFHDFSSGYTQLDHRGAIEFAASHNEPVLIVGETGTGKEYVAQAIHRRWVQEQHRFHPELTLSDDLTVVNCAAISAGLARSELFGSVYGAYTGSHGHQIGLILEACGFSRITTPPSVATNASSDFEAKLADNSPAKREIDPTNPQKISETKLLNKPKDKDPVRYLSIAHEGPFGTIFLDELADLPIEAQTLLLRYLESFEVTPLSYARTIKGARVRLIAATSDPRVAAFVGQKVFAPRSAAELSRPLRDDFLFRLKGQVIRTQPITSNNALEIVRHFVKDSQPNWDRKAIEWLAKSVGKVAKQIEDAVNTDRDPGLRFGHLREIERIVKLANTYVREARRRGIRTVGETVSEEVVQQLWKPSRVLSSELGPPTTHANLAGDPCEAEEFRAKFEELFAAGGHSLPPNWKSDQFRAIVQEHFLEDTPIGTNLLKLLSRFTADGLPDSILQAALGEYDGQAKTVRTWFSKRRAERIAPRKLKEA